LHSHFFNLIQLDTKETYFAANEKKKKEFYEKSWEEFVWSD